MAKSSGLIALLLVLAITLQPFERSSEIEILPNSPQPICGEFTGSNDTMPQGENENDTAKIIAATVIVIIIICLIFYMADTETG